MTVLIWSEFIYHQSPDFYHLGQSFIPFDRSSSSLSNISKFSINSFVVLDRPLGYGGFGVVHLGRHTPTSTLVAIKTISTAHESTDVTEGRNREIDVLNRIPSHPCINQLLSVLNKGETVHLVLELVTGGDLFGYVCKHVQDGGLIESEVKWLAYQMVQGVSWLHKHGVVHRGEDLLNGQS
jgi:serine/threonine protein kinase